MNEQIQQKIEEWLQGDFDETSKNEIKILQKDDPKLLAEAFYRNLEFGTGGLRGLMGVGTNRMNKYTVGMCTQAFSNYLIRSYPQEKIKVVVGCDSRNNSRFFAETTAAVFAANGIQVFLFEQLRPTPELSFAIRHLNCHGGVVCTASHNPKEYNGYKAYWNDGGQLVPPHDFNVICEVGKIKSINEVKWGGNQQDISLIGKEIDEAYINMIKGLSIFPEKIKKQEAIKIVYTPIHGTGITLVPDVLKQFGFMHVTVVEEQATPDGNFPTVVYPNPEESEAMAFGLKKAKEIDADILLGTDPDSDRVGVGVKDTAGNWVLLNGNQTAVLAFNYLIEARRAKGIAKENDMVVSTIVTTEMIKEIAKVNHIHCYTVLTGFKWIAELVKEKEGVENYIIGGEESFGLMIGDKVRDKDAISAVALLCEMVAYEKDNGRSLYQKLISLYREYGFYKEHLISITKKGMDGQEQIEAMMAAYRNTPPQYIASSRVVTILDYQLQLGRTVNSNAQWELRLPQSNVLQFILEDGSKISIRPSGTEPKIKFYFSVKAPLDDESDFDFTNVQLQKRIDLIMESLQLTATK